MNPSGHIYSVPKPVPAKFSRKKETILAFGITACFTLVWFGSYFIIGNNAASTPLEVVSISNQEATESSPLETANQQVTSESNSTSTETTPPAETEPVAEIVNEDTLSPEYEKIVMDAANAQLDDTSVVEFGQQYEESN